MDRVLVTALSTICCCLAAVQAESVSIAWADAPATQPASASAPAEVYSSTSTAPIAPPIIAPAGTTAPATTGPAASGPAATAPAEIYSSTAPAARDAVSPEALALLERLEAAGHKYKSLRADLTYHVLMKQLGDSELRKGWVAYQHPSGDQPGMFRVHFDTLKLGDGPDRKEMVDYGFDGHYLAIAKHRIKEMTFVQVTPEGQKAQPLQLGEGPFPLPFGQDVDEVLSRFSASAEPPAAVEGPPGTAYLRLVPLPEQADQVSFVRLEMWIDPKLDLPARIVSEDTSLNVTTVDFGNLQTDPQLPENTFRLKRGQFGWNWQYHTRRLEEMESLEP